MPKLFRSFIFEWFVTNNNQLSVRGQYKQKSGTAVLVLWLLMDVLVVEAEVVNAKKRVRYVINVTDV